jgi:hypothetical protein
VQEAKEAIAGWEASLNLEASQPQISVGEGVAHWLPALEAAAPREALDPVGVPAIQAFARR